MLKHLLVGAVLTSSVALAEHRYPSTSAVPQALPPAGIAMPQGPAGNSRADDRFDAMRSARLLTEFEAAAAGRDRRAMASVDARFQAFVSQEIAEARKELGKGRGRAHGRFGKSFEARRTLSQLEDLQVQISRLAGRVDRRSVSQKRMLYTQANALARSELEDFGHRRG